MLPNTSKSASQLENKGYYWARELDHWTRVEAFLLEAMIDPWC